MTKHTQIMIDPPWDISMAGKKESQGGLATKLPYKTLNTQEIISLYRESILPLAAEKHSLWLWATEKTFVTAILEWKYLGYNHHATIIWNKGNGLSPAFTVRYSHEYLLWMWKGGLQPVSNDARGKYTTVFFEQSREHSRKPEAAYDMIECLYPEDTKLDVFARERRAGWSAWGNEVGKFDWRWQLFNGNVM